MNKIVVASKKSSLRRRLRRIKGAGAVEYILVVTVVAVGLIVAFQAFRTQVQGKFAQTGGQVMQAR